MTHSDADFERRLEESLGPVAPPAHLRAALFPPSTSRPVWARVAALVLPYAAGLATALLLHPPTPAPTPPAGVSFDSIADRPPVPVLPAEPDDASDVETDPAPLPRIS